MRTANLLRLQVEQIPVYDRDHVQIQQFKPMALISCDGDSREFTEEEVEVKDLRIMDVHLVTKFGEKKRNYIVFTPEVEELLGIPCDLMHQQKQDIQELNEHVSRLRHRIKQFESMTLWQKLKALLWHKIF